jgi:MFS transporter, FHS family, glucose/mannose:H+ symporter
MRFVSAITSCSGSSEQTAAAMAGAVRQFDRPRQMRTEGASDVSIAAPASRTEIGVVYFAGMVQGLALVTFPAASAIFTGADGFGFDSTRYGALFVPQVVMAVLASGLAPQLARRWGLRRVLLLGIAGNIVSMALLALSRLLLGAPGSAFVLLLVATGALGLGFGATVMALNTYAEAFFPEQADDAVLALNALLGLGTALAPVLVAVVTGMGVWWLLPLVVASILALIIAVVLAQVSRPDLAIDRGARGAIGAEALPGRYWLYAAAVFLYGILETLNGNWAPLYLSGERGVSPRGASMALATFWAMVTVGRVLVAAIAVRVPARSIYLALPLLLVITFQLASRVQGELGGILAFGMSGLACSAFLPLSISFGGGEFPRLSAVMAGGMIAFYQLGYGVAAFATGPLRDLMRLRFSTIFASGSAIAVLLVVVAALIVRWPRVVDRHPPKT